MEAINRYGSNYNESSGTVGIQEQKWAILHPDLKSSISYNVKLSLIGEYRLQIDTLAGSEETILFGGSVFFDDKFVGNIEEHKSNGTNNLLRNEFLVNVDTKGEHILKITNQIQRKNSNDQLCRLHLRVIEISIRLKIGIRSITNNPDIFPIHRTLVKKSVSISEENTKTDIKRSNKRSLISDDYESDKYSKIILCRRGSEYTNKSGNVETQEQDWEILHPVQNTSISYDFAIDSIGMHNLQVKTLAGAEELLMFGGSVYFDHEFIGDIGIHWSAGKTCIFENNYIIDISTRGQHTITISNKVLKKGSNDELCKLHLRVMEISISIKSEVRAVIDNPALFGVDEEFIEILKEHISGLKDIDGGKLYEDNFMGHVGADHFKIYTDYINKFKEISGSFVLELGCGSGGSLPLFRSYGAKVAGIEIDPNLVKLTNSRIKFLDNAYCMQADGFNLPFADETFDICLCSHVLEHVDIPHEMVKEINRVLKTGGIALIEFPNRLYPVEPHGNLLLVPYLPLKIARLYAKILGSMWFISDEYRSRLNVLHLLKGEYSYFSIKSIIKKLPFKICDINPIERLILDMPAFENYSPKFKRISALLFSRSVTIIVRKAD